MSRLSAEQLPAIAGSLMRLRGDTLASVGAATGIRPANLSVWLRGKEQVISAKRVATLMYFLGVEGGRLRVDMLHKWQDAGALADLSAVVGALILGDQPVLLFRDHVSSLTKTRFLLVGEALLRIEVTPTPSANKDVIDVVAPGRVASVYDPLSGVPVERLEEARGVLAGLAEQAVTPHGNEESLGATLFHLTADFPSVPPSSSDDAASWTKLERAIRSALHAGATPAQIARWIDAENEVIRKP